MDPEYTGTHRAEHPDGDGLAQHGSPIVRGVTAETVGDVRLLGEVAEHVGVGDAVEQAGGGVQPGRPLPR